MTIAEQLIESGKRSGLQQGLHEGLEKGTIEGEKTLLIRLLTRRFGYLPAEKLQKIEKADGMTLLSWGDKILDAKSLSDVFDE